MQLLLPTFASQTKEPAEASSVFKPSSERHSHLHNPPHPDGCDDLQGEQGRNTYTWYSAVYVCTSNDHYNLCTAAGRILLNNCTRL
jgi:hypothetical protein